MISYLKNNNTRDLCNVTGLSEGIHGYQIWLPANVSSTAMGDTENHYLGSLHQGRPVITGDKPVIHFKLHGTLIKRDPKLKMCSSAVDPDALFSNEFSVLATSGPGFDHYPCLGPGLSTGLQWEYGIRYSYKTAYIRERVRYTEVAPHMHVVTREYNNGAIDKFSGEIVEQRFSIVIQIYYPRYDKLYHRWSWECRDNGYESIAITQTPDQFIDQHWGLLDSKAQEWIDKQGILGSASVDAMRGPCRHTDIRQVTSGAVSTREAKRFRDHLVSRQYFWKQPDYDWSELCQKSIDNLNYVDINTVQYLREIKDTLSEIQALKKLLGNPTNPKAWASLFLNMEYGTKLTLSDTKELILALKKAASDVRRISSHSWKFCRARKSSSFTVGNAAVMNATVDYNYKVYYNPHDEVWRRIISTCAEWDVLPTLGNVWDMIPYSFVMNWFIDVESMLVAIDTRAAINRLDVIGTLYTEKIRYPITPDYLFEGMRITNGYFSSYRRKWSRSLHLPAVSLGLSDGYKRNIPQLLAILVQRS